MNNPLRDGCFFVDNSMIDLITTCPWLAYASIVRQRRPSDESPALRFGGFIHKALEYRNTNIALGTPWSEAEQVNLLSKWFTDAPLETEGWRNLDSAVKVIQGYNAQYPPGKDFTIMFNHKIDRPYVEQSFACDTHTVVRGWCIIYTGRIDLKVRMPGNSHFVFDHKTSSVLGDTTWADWAISDQFRGYCWADRECTGEEPDGYYVDAIGARESLLNAAFDPVQGRVVPLGKSKAVPLELQRQPFFTKVPTGQLDEWFSNMLDQVDMFLYYLERGVWPRHHKHCVSKYGMCQFYNVCSLPAESREPALMSSAYKDNEWTPLYL